MEDGTDADNVLESFLGSDTTILAAEKSAGHSALGVTAFALASRPRAPHTDIRHA